MYSEENRNLLLLLKLAKEIFKGEYTHYVLILSSLNFGYYKAYLLNTFIFFIEYTLVNLVIKNNMHLAY